MMYVRKHSLYWIWLEKFAAKTFSIKFQIQDKKTGKKDENHPHQHHIEKHGE